MNRNNKAYGGAFWQVFSFILFLIFLFVGWTAGFNRPVHAQTPAVIPDQNLKKALHEACKVPLNEKLYKENLGELTGDLDLSGKNITSLEGIEAAIYVEGLDASDNPLSSLPEDMGKMYSLMRLNLDRCQFTRIPPVVAKLPILQKLSMNNNKIAEAAGVSGCLYLDYLYLDGNLLTTFPAGLKLPSLSVLSLAGNKLSVFPPSILALDSLHEIDVSRNSLQSLPEGLGDMPNLYVLRAEKNLLRAIPGELGKGPLVQLHVAENRLTTLPVKLFDAKNLIILDAGCNRLTQVPQGMEKRQYEALTLLFNFIDFSPGSSGMAALDKVSAVNKAYQEQLIPIRELAASPGTSDAVLAWLPCPDIQSDYYTAMIRHYDIYLDDKGALTLLGTADKNLSNYKVEDLEADTDYLFWVGAVYDVNMTSVYSQAVTRHYTPVSVHTLPLLAPGETGEETAMTEEAAASSSLPFAEETEMAETSGETEEFKDPGENCRGKWFYAILGGIAGLALAVIAFLLYRMLKGRGQE